MMSDDPKIFAQEARTDAARAAWQPLPGVGGAYQLLWVQVDGPRRAGHGSAVLRQVLHAAAGHGERAGSPLRRMIALVPQPLVIPRAWLLRNGFVHVHTLDELAKDAEVLVMMRTFD